jgi:hypothetical protein
MSTQNLRTPRIATHEQKPARGPHGFRYTQLSTVMSTMVTEVYEALRKAGVDEQLAKDAARAVLPADAGTDLVTKADLAAGLAELKAELIKWNVGAMAILTAIFAAIARLA